MLCLAALTLVPALTLSAQDNKATDCLANGDDANWQCEQVNPSAFERLDWWPLEALPAALINRECINCGGRYIDPLAGFSASRANSDTTINADADSPGQADASEAPPTPNAD